MKKIYGYAFASALMALASCSSDAPEIVDGPVLNGDGVGYMKLSFDGATAGTRAELDAAEKGVNNVTFAFYNASGALIETVYVSDVATDGAEENKFVNGDKKCAIVKVSQVPHFVEAYVNTSGKTSYTTGIGTDQQASAFSDGIYTSAVYNNGGATTKTPLDGNMIYHTPSAAAAGDANTTTIFVDRLYAKVDINVTNDAEKLKLEKGFDGYTIQFKPIYAFVNGVAKSTTILKGLNTSAQGVTFDANALYTTSDDMKMSHWAAATDHAWNKTTHYAVEGDKITTLSGKTTYLYENTPASKGTTKDFTHVIVAGKYILTGADGEPVQQDQTFWTFGTKEGLPVIYFEEAKLLEAMGAPSYDALVDITTNVNTAEGTESIIGKQYGNLVCNEYKNGWVYYAAPIHHSILGAVNGIVRNHSYIVNINEITGYGVPLPNPDKPIIPEEPKEDPGTYHLQLNIQVNDWSGVPNQDFRPWN
ncbi:MAG: Mfa1 family fimbria major subunit [Muribaculaceae bacterium]|nr:Mfa1 family fimbria major subunit [Muribaculaceae bacterium]